MDMLQAGCIIGLMKKSHKTNCWYVEKYLFVTDVLLGMETGPHQVLADTKYVSGLSSMGVLGVPWHTHILADQLTLFQPGGTDYAHLFTTGTPGFSDLPTALRLGSNRTI